jgi:nickel transport protein
MKYLLLALVLSCPHLHAHGIRLFAAYEGNRLTGRAYSGSKGIANVTVTLLNTDGSHRSTVTTDADGNFSKTMNKRVSLKLTIKLPDGHRGHFNLDLGEPEESDKPHSHEDDDHNDHAHDHASDSKRDVAGLEAELAKLQGQRRLRDVIGGIGFVFGLAGILIMIKSRKRDTPPSA